MAPTDPSYVGSNRDRYNSGGAGLTKLRNELRRLKVLNHDDRGFYPERRMLEIFDTVLLDLVLKDICAGLTQDTQGRRTAVLLQDAKHRQYLYAYYRKTLAILVLIDKSELIWEFRAKNQHDGQLPLSRDKLGKLLIENDAVEDFYKKQYRFAVPYFETNPGLASITIEDEQLVPILSKKELASGNGRGGYGTVYQIEIHADYDRLHGSCNRGTDSRTIYAMKQLNSENSDEGSFKREVEVQDMLHNKTDDIMQWLAYFSHRGKYFLVLPLADCNLESYLQDYNPPTTADDRLALLKSFGAIFSALEVLHHYNNEKVYANRITVGFHHDLTPKNILWMSKTNRFYLADFGVAQIRNIHLESKSGDSYPLGQSTYSAPECKYKLKLGRKLDIWSVVCILAVLVTFVEGGQNALEKFQMKRIQTTEFEPNINIERFHDGKVVLPEVLKWLSDYKTSAGALIKDISCLIIEVLSSGSEAANKRPNAHELRRRYADILDREEIRLGILNRVEVVGLGLTSRSCPTNNGSIEYNPAS